LGVDVDVDVDVDANVVAVVCLDDHAEDKLGTALCLYVQAHDSVSD